MLQNLRNWVIQKPAQQHYMHVHHIDRVVLERNRMFCNAHKGERCFIVGNGPSVKQQDLSLMANEQVFTVNYAYRMEQFADMRPNYHFYMDPTCFVDEMNPPKTFTAVAEKSPDVICFLAYAGGMEYAQRHAEMEQLHPHFLFPYYGFDVGLPVCAKLDEGISNFYTVIQTAILAAVYMGFSKIYLVGCDCTGIITDLEVMQNKEVVNGYAYSFDQAAKDRLAQFYASEIHLEDTFYGWGNIFKGYRIVGDFCREQGVELWNATHGGALDVLPRVNYESLF